MHQETMDDVLVRRGYDVRSVIGLGQYDSASDAKDAGDLRHRLRGLRGVDEHGTAVDGVERGGLERQLLTISDSDRYSSRPAS
jgi:hypothetical protein